VWGPAAAPGPGVIGQAVQAVPVNAVDGYAAWPPTGFANGVAAWPPTNFANGVAGNGTVPAVSPIPVHIASADFPALAPPGLDILQDPFA